jgi:tRNA synthetases class II (A)
MDQVGDPTQLTFFEMLGNWSLGAYFQWGSITWSQEFLTRDDLLAIPPRRLWISVFAGNQATPADAESAGIWRALGIPAERIVYLGEEHNWWALRAPAAPTPRSSSTPPAPPALRAQPAGRPWPCGVPHRHRSHRQGRPRPGGAAAGLLVAVIFAVVVAANIVLVRMLSRSHHGLCYRGSAVRGGRRDPRHPADPLAQAPAGRVEAMIAGVKGRERQVPLWALMLATVWLDIVFVPCWPQRCWAVEGAHGVGRRWPSGWSVTANRS